MQISTTRWDGERQRPLTAKLRAGMGRQHVVAKLTEDKKYSIITDYLVSVYKVQIIFNQSFIFGKKQLSLGL
jgi:hypothetical protein